MFWIGGRLRKVVALGDSSIGHMYSYRADQYFLPEFTLSWIIQTYKYTMMHTRLNKEQPPEQKVDRMFQIIYPHPRDKCLSAVTFETP